jgi:hypothetical protein
MRKTVTSLFISLDGVVEAQDDWQFAYLDDDTFGALTTAWDRVDAALMGRRSFQGFDEVRTANPDSPVIGGVRLFPEESAADPLARLGLDLTSVTSLGSGALQVTYTPATS